MSRTDRVAQDLADAAAVYAAREEIVRALGPLAASPLDERAAAQMRQALQRAESLAVRRALRRMSRRGQARPPLLAVPVSADGSGTAARSQAPPDVASRAARQLPTACAGSVA